MRYEFSLNSIPGVAGLAAMVLAVMIATAPSVRAQDPMASNNGLYPQPQDWNGRYLTANLAYPETSGPNAWPFSDAGGALSVADAPAYARRLQEHLGKTLRVLIDSPQDWDPVAAGWYDMVWSGEGIQTAAGIDPTSGREALMNTYTGQIIPPAAFDPAHRPKGPVQNHAVIYYNSTAASVLQDIWADIYAPDPGAASFRDGSIIVKVEAVTNSPDDWPVIQNSSAWHVFRPTTQDQAGGVVPLVPRVLPVHPLQIAVRVKDPVASPRTGWVFAAFVYDRDAPGGTAWDRFVPLGLQWGNDPQAARTPSGIPQGGLQESWINPGAPAFTHGTLGWGGRLSGPMDVSGRHNVITTSGRHYQGGDHLAASSCQSCHGAAEFPRTANLYPSPNRSFPRDGAPFLLYDPGSADWARWFQNRPGSQSLTGNRGVTALDYDMVLMFALSAFNEAVGNAGYEQELFDVH